MLDEKLKMKAALKMKSEINEVEMKSIKELK